MGPGGERREDLRAGVIAAAMVNCHLRAGAKTYGPEDFLLYERPRKKSAAEMKAALVQHQLMMQSLHQAGAGPADGSTPAAMDLSAEGSA